MYKSQFINLIFIIGSLITSLLVYFSGSKNGPGATFDSYHYLYAALSLYEKGVLILPSQRPYIEWPPLYATIICFIYSISGNIVKGVFFFQIIVAGLTTWLSGVLARKFIQNQIVLIIAFMFITFSTPIILINYFIWSESFFVFLFILHLIAFYKYIYRSNNIIWWLLVITGSLLCLQRHVGVFLVAGTILALLQFPTDVVFKKRFLKSILYGVITVIPLSSWWLRNYLVRGQIIYDYSASLFTIDFVTHWAAYQNVFTSWFLPDELPVWIRTIIVFALISFLGYRYYRRRKSSFSPQVLLGFLTIFFAYYLFTYIASFAVNEYLDDRILAPIYLPGIIIFFCLLDSFYTSLNSILYKKLVYFACIFWAIYPITRSIANTWKWHNQEIRVIPDEFKDTRFREKFEKSIKF